MDEFLDKYIFPYTGKYIGRSKMTEDGLPVYSRKEERFNMASHIIGTFFGIGMIVVSVLYAGSYEGMIGGVIYGICLLQLYWASSVYHGIPIEDTDDKKIFRIVDHCSIFILVAGTCTPCIFTLIHHDRNPYEWIFYGVLWLAAIGGIILLCIDMKRFKSIATLMYVAMGAMMISRTYELSKIIGETGTYMLIGGAAAYLIGLLFYGLGSRREWMHSIFHILCLVGSLLHCICIGGFVI